jgi:hypothetical protein
MFLTVGHVCRTVGTSKFCPLNIMRKMGALETNSTLALQMNVYIVHVLTNEGDGFQWKSEEESVQLVCPQLLYDGLHRRSIHNHTSMLISIPKQILIGNELELGYL